MKKQPTNRVWNLEIVVIILQQVHVYCNILEHIASYGALVIQKLKYELSQSWYAYEIFSHVCIRHMRYSIESNRFPIL